MVQYMEFWTINHELNGALFYSDAAYQTKEDQAVAFVSCIVGVPGMPG